MKHAIILAGGKGSRLRAVVSSVAKPMAPVGDKPFLHFVLAKLALVGIESVSLLLGYKHETVTDYFGNGFRGMRLEYQIEQQPLGTGGALKKAFKLQRQPVLVLNGDTFLDFEKLNSECSNGGNIIFCKYMDHASRYGTVIFDETGRVIAHGEPSKQPSYINVGAYHIESPSDIVFSDEESFSWEDFIAKRAKSLQFRAGLYDGEFVDIGVPSDYEYFRLKYEDTRC